MQLIETYVPVTQARGRLLELIKDLQNNDDTVAITKNGVPEAVLLSYEHFAELIETMEVLADSKLMTQIERSKKDAEAGRVYEPVAELDQYYCNKFYSLYNGCPLLMQ